MNNLFEIFKDLIACATPFLLCYITYRTNKKEKLDKTYREIQEKNVELERNIVLEKQNERDNIILELQKEIKHLKDNLSEVTDKVDTISEEVSVNVSNTLNELLKLNSVNLTYCQSLSSLIATIGKGMKDSEKVNISEAIEKHQQKERELFASIVKSSC